MRNSLYFLVVLGRTGVVKTSAQCEATKGIVVRKPAKQFHLCDNAQRHLLALITSYSTLYTFYESFITGQNNWNILIWQRGRGCIFITTPFVFYYLNKTPIRRLITYIDRKKRGGIVYNDTTVTKWKFACPRLAGAA